MPCASSYKNGASKFEVGPPDSKEYCISAISEVKGMQPNEYVIKVVDCPSVQKTAHFGQSTYYECSWAVS